MLCTEFASSYSMACAQVNTLLLSVLNVCGWLSVVPGYRHIQLRTQHNEPLEVSSLFIYSRRVEESPTGTALPAAVVTHTHTHTPEEHLGIAYVIVALRTASDELIS